MIHQGNGKPKSEVLVLPVVRTTPGTNGKPLAEAKPQANTSAAELTWNEDSHAAENYAALGTRLAATGNVYRNAAYGNGLLLVLPGGRHVSIAKGLDLLPIIVDRLRVRVMKDGKVKGSTIPAAHLSAMLKSEKFLDQFTTVDLVIKTPMYLPDFTLTRTGYNDGGPGHRIVYTGGEPVIGNSLDAINAFLGVMDFETAADRTNAVAAALTVTLRNHWRGGKPIIVATAMRGGWLLVKFGIRSRTTVTSHLCMSCRCRRSLSPLPGGHGHNAAGRSRETARRVTDLLLPVAFRSPR